MQQTNGGSNDFSPKISVITYDGIDNQLIDSFSKQTYPASKILSSRDTESFLSGLQEVIGTSDIVAFAKGGTVWAPKRLERLAEGFRLNPSSIGVVYTDWTNHFNMSYSIKRFQQDPNFIKGDIAVACYAISDKSLQKPEVIDENFFRGVMQALMQTHVFIHVGEVLGTWK